MGGNMIKNEQCEHLSNSQVIRIRGENILFFFFFQFSKYPSPYLQGVYSELHSPWEDFVLHRESAAETKQLLHIRYNKVHKKFTIWQNWCALIENIYVFVPGSKGEKKQNMFNCGYKINTKQKESLRRIEAVIVRYCNEL